jgi:hypothetical protein
LNEFKGIRRPEFLVPGLSLVPEVLEIMKNAPTQLKVIINGQTYERVEIIE